MAADPMSTETGAGLDLNVEQLPPPPEQPRADDAPPPGEPEPAPPSTRGEWTDADLAALVGYVKMPYDLAALRAGDYWKLTDAEAKMIATPLSGVIPVAWVREVHERSPILAAITALGAIYIVTSPRLARLRAEQEAAIGSGGPSAAPSGPRGDGGRGDRGGAAAREPAGDDRRGGAGAQSNGAVARGTRSPLIDLVEPSGAR